MLDTLKDIFLYHEGKPLLFTQLYFWIFFILVYSVFVLIYKRFFARSLYLFVVSLFFYYKSSGSFFALLLFTTVFDYAMGFAIFHSKGKFLKNFAMVMSVIANLLILFYFKYTYFIADSINSVSGSSYEVKNILSIWSNNLFGTSLDISKIILPVGVSFFTFQSMSYTLDIYFGKLRPVKSVIDFGFYVTFFPQLVAGPIVRAADFIPQIYKKFELSKQEFGFAIFLILNGLVKKMAIADYISTNYVDRVFDNPLSYSGFDNLMAIYGYALQIYCDFSGYTDIAIGVALLFGFRLLLNFNSPYKAQNITDFWRRWHISLSTWLKDYLYIPLGGNKKTSFATIFLTILFIGTFIYIASIMGFIWLVILGFMLIVVLFYFYVIKVPLHNYLNLLITMLLGGLWHGANIRFIIWGALHGFGLALHKIFIKITNKQSEYKPESRFRRVVFIIITFHFVCFTWIFFRATTMDNVFAMLKQIFTNFNFVGVVERIIAFKFIFLAIFIGFVIHFLPKNFKDFYSMKFVGLPIYFKISIILIVLFFLYQIKSSDIQPFIYFQF